jgi:hypothetical protein
MAVDIAMGCLKDLVAKVNTVPMIKDKVVSVYTEKELMDAAVQLTPPCVGVVYEGMRAVPDQDKLSRGTTVELMFSVILVISGKSFGNVSELRPIAADVLDQFRSAVKLTQNPFGQYWKFMVESAVQETDGGFLYVQRWATRAMLTANG